ncbi:hypothetical protein B1R94_12860 [Mycolicibacterium litorale]|nr:hypothetical protein B1R94_12860 [Mycolicibacterium litorale]
MKRFPGRLGAVAAVLLYAATIFAAPADADPAGHVPCGVLSQVRESLDDDITAGIDGVRTVISSPYVSGAAQKRDAETRLAMVSHGVHYMQDVNGDNIVPELAALLENLDRASNDMRDAVEALFQISGGGYGFGSGDYGPTLSLAWPQPSTWTAIDYADQKKNDIYALLNGLQGTCAP